MAGGIVRSPAAWRGGAPLFGKVAHQTFSHDVIREDEPLWTRSALRSMIFHCKLLRFFLAVREKAVVRLSEGEASGAPVNTVEAFCTLNVACKRHLKVVGEKCAAHLGLTNGFQMALRYPPSGPSDYRTCLLYSGWPSVGPASWLRCLPRRSCCMHTDRH
uniref:Uncharacterized protein n=1 Tax=Phasianus colchicus TaxID=9054 RepID=A0A669QPK7_PHACC